jgi:hypothetical protein
MTWCADLGPNTMIHSGPHVRAIGWLSAKHPYPTGIVSPEILGRIREFCQRWPRGLEPLHWGAFCGMHTCELCGSCRTSGNVGLPANGLLYVFPEMLEHYVAIHGYLPPSEFLDAVMHAPLQGTAAYVEAVAPFRRYVDEQVAAQRKKAIARLVRPQGVRPRAHWVSTPKQRVLAAITTIAIAVIGWLIWASTNPPPKPDPDLDAAVKRVKEILSSRPAK